MFNRNLDLGMKSELSIFLGLTKVEAPKTPQRRRTKNIFNVESRKDAVKFRKYLYDTICRHPRTVYDLMFLYKRGALNHSSSPAHLARGWKDREG